MKTHLVGFPNITNLHVEFDPQLCQVSSASSISPPTPDFASYGGLLFSKTIVQDPRRCRQINQSNHLPSKLYRSIDLTRHSPITSTISSAGVFFFRTASARVLPSCRLPTQLIPTSLPSTLVPLLDARFQPWLKLTSAAAAASQP